TIAVLLRFTLSITRNTIMKRTVIGFGLAASLAATSGVSAGDLSGSLALDLNSHFISYGLDVWTAGDDQDILFNPSLGIDYAVTDTLTLNAGIWMDINDQASPSLETVETDIWIGASYDVGFGSVSATFQNWQYGGTSEEILDIGLSLDTILSPTLTLHKRLGAGASGGEEGLFIVGDISHEFALTDAFSVGLSSAVGFAATEFHTQETGFGYASLGASVSYALSDISSIYASVTYYITDEDVINNSGRGGEDDFLTFGTGISFSF
ncbi:MAG: hypothetical protein AAGC74_13830, partial [Verrucomicrobiota bacterium]